MEVNMVGNERVDNVSKLYETISMHDARRSFVCNSLAFGIPANIVQACTGHSDLQTMTAYVGTVNSTVKKELKKWSTKPVRQRIDALLDMATEEQLQTVLDLVNELLKAEK